MRPWLLLAIGSNAIEALTLARCHACARQAILNFYAAGDAIPPHVDHHDFARPFATLSLGSTQPIAFAQRFRVVSEGACSERGGCAVW